MASKKEQEGNNNNYSTDDDHLISSSPTIITKYAHRSSRLIYSIEKNLYVIIAIVAVLVVVSIIDAFEVIGITNFIGEGLDDMIIAILSLDSLAALVPMLRLSLESKKMLEEWANMFEYNSIKNSITMSLTIATKEELVYAVGETVKEIGDPLLKYVEKGGGNFSEFFNVAIGETIFDVLIDSETVKADKEGGADLKKILGDYGAIIIRIVDGKISKKELLSFSSDISKYTMQRSRRIKEAIGLAIMIGREISPDAYSTARSRNMKVKDILLIEKP
jgi:hypothetical protein